MSMYEQVYQKAAALLSETVGIHEDEIRPETALCADPDMELIDMAKYVMACEKKFDMTIHDEDVHTFLCFKDIVRYIVEVLFEGEQSVSVSSDKEREAWYYR